jgi:hypothetical protein
VTPRPKLPAHGTVQRYRAELADQKAGKGKGPCDRCRAANSERAKTARVNAAAKARRAQMVIVEPVTDSGQTEVSQPAAKSTADRKRKIGVMETAVQADIDEIDVSLQVPFHRSLTALAIELAQEIDEPATAAAARRDARKQLFEVLRSLRTQKEGDDGSALNVLLEQAGFGVPLVPQGSAKVRNSPQP